MVGAAAGDLGDEPAPLAGVLAADCACESCMRWPGAGKLAYWLCEREVAGAGRAELLCAGARRAKHQIAKSPKGQKKKDQRPAGTAGPPNVQEHQPRRRRRWDGAARIIAPG